MTPTPEQLNNRKLLAQEVRTLLESERVYPTYDDYISDDYNDFTCSVCAVGSLVVAQAHRKDPGGTSLESAAMNLMADLGAQSAMIALSELTGLSYWEVKAFEAAYMGRVVTIPGVDLDYAERKGDTHNDSLIKQALEWSGTVKPTSLKDRLLMAMDLMESWAEGPVSFPLPAAKKEG